jgi:hypothetical protein
MNQFHLGLPLFSGIDFRSSTADLTVSICLDALKTSRKLKICVVEVKLGFEDCTEGFTSIGSVQQVVGFRRPYLWRENAASLT